jgi:hypothetical protein
MAMMHVLVVELLYQAVMEQIPVLKCLVLGARGCLWICPILPDINIVISLGPVSGIPCSVLATHGCASQRRGRVQSRVTQRIYSG